MSSTVEQLNETTNTENLYVLGTQNNQSVKYNIELVENKINKYNDLIGEGEIQEYSSLNNYYIGSYIKLNNKIYRVTEDIYAGENIEGKIVETSVFSEIQTIKGTGSTETLNVQILTSDNNTSPTILQNNVNLTFSDGGTAQILCDSTGHGSISIAKGRIYSASVVNQAGYHTPGTYKNIKASLSQRTLQFIYTRQWSGNSTISVELSVTNGGVPSDFVGKTLIMAEDGTENFWTSSNGILDNNKIIYTFPQVISGKSYTITIFYSYSDNYIVNDRLYKSLSGQTVSINPNTENQAVSIGYRFINQNYGIFLVKNDGTEIDIGSWEGLGNGEDKNTWPLLHINTQECAESGNDYYVRCRDLTGERLATESTTKQWATSNIFLSHVEANSNSANLKRYNGKQETFYMAYDSRNSDNSSPAAEFANSQVTEINGLQVKGFIGTIKQMYIIYRNSDNIAAVRNALTKLGYSNINFNTTNTWSASQGDAYAAYFFHNNGSAIAGQSKTVSLLVVPFFAVP